MGYCINVEEVSGEEISPGVIKRVLLKPENTGKGLPGDLTVTHYTLMDGGILTLEEPDVEYQDYIVSDSVLFGRKYIHGILTQWRKSHIHPCRRIRSEDHVHDILRVPPYA